ncbi:MAG: 3-oxoacyl-ACP reductase FabG [Solirubrobacterales bacterium]
MSAPAARFEGRLAIVTGAARGIGAAISRRLAEEGATVVGVDLDPRVVETMESLVREGYEAEGITANVADADAVEKSVGAVADRHGRIDVLVNNAGITRDDLLFKLSEDDWDTVIDVNLKSVFLCSRAAQRLMVEARKGAIVSLSSRSALGNRGQANYSAAKAGIRGLTSTMALELGPFGIRVNAVAPGYIATEMTGQTAIRLGLDPEAHQEKAAAVTPLRRVGSPEEVASVVAFLASDDASYVSGQTIEINGGAR